MKRFSGGKLLAVVESATEDGLVVQRDSAVETFDRADVKRVRLVSDEKTTSGRITGMAILGTMGGMCTATCDGKPGGSGAGRVPILPTYLDFGYRIGWAADGPKKITLHRARRN